MLCASAATQDTGRRFVYESSTVYPHDSWRRSRRARDTQLAERVFQGTLMTQGTFIGGSKTGKKHHGWSGQTNSSSRCESVPTAVGIVRPLYISTSTKICCTAVVTQHSITSRLRWVTGSSMYDLCLGGRPHKNDSPASKLHDRGGHKHTHSKCARWQRPFRSPILEASSLPLLAPALVVGVFTF